MPIREQILSALADGEKKTAELVAAVDGYPTAIRNGIKRLVDEGKIVKVKWACMYCRKGNLLS